MADRKLGRANHRAKTSLSWHDGWHGLASGQPIYGHLLTPRARGDGHCGRLPAPPGTGSQKAPTMAAPPGTGSQKAPTVGPHVTFIHYIHFRIFINKYTYLFIYGLSIYVFVYYLLVYCLCIYLLIYVFICVICYLFI